MKSSKLIRCEKEKKALKVLTRVYAVTVSTEYSFCWVERHSDVKIQRTLTRKTLSASSHTCIPLDSNTSTHPRYLTAKVQVLLRTADSSACHWCGFELSGTRSLRFLKESLKDRRNLSILRGDRKLRLCNQTNKTIYILFTLDTGKILLTV